MLEPLIYCYRLDNDYIIYRKVKEGLWGIVKEKDSAYSPKSVKNGMIPESRP